MSRKEYYDPIVQKSTSYNPYIAGPYVALKEPIDVALLSEVIEELRTRFPYFYGKVNVEDDDLVIVPNPLPIVVRDSWEPIKLFSNESNYHFMSVKVDGNRFAIEFSHALSDGTGFLAYLKSLLFCYLTRKTGKKFDPTGFHLPGEEIPESETGNPFAGFDLDSVELSVPDTLSPDQIYRFSEEKIGERNHNNVVFMQMPESTVMNYCKQKGTTPNVLISTLLVRAMRRFDPESKKVIRVGVAIDGKSIVGNMNNYRAFPEFAHLDYYKEQENIDLEETLKTKRDQLKAEASVEKILHLVKGVKLGWEMLSQFPLQTKIDFTQKAFIQRAQTVSVVVSYVKTKTFGPLDPYVQELYGIAEPCYEDVVCELKCLNNTFFLSYIQSFEDKTLFNFLLNEFEKINIPYEIKRIEPLILSGVRFDELQGLNI